MFDWMNSNSGALNVVFTFVVAASTVVYAVLTARLVAETRRMRRVQTNPSISVHVEPSEFGLNFINLHIRNTGAGAARNLRLRLSRDYEWMSGRRLSERGLFKHAIPYLAPGQVLTTFLLSILDHTRTGSNSLGHLNFGVIAEYESDSGETFSETIAVNFEHFEDLIGIGTPPLISIHREMERIRQAAESLTSGRAKVRAVTYSVAEEEAENQAILKRHEAKRVRSGTEEPEVSPNPTSPWRIRLEQADLDRLRTDAAFAELLTLGRISNLIRAASAAGDASATGDDVVSHRQRISMLLLVGGLVAEALVTFERLGKHFRAYKAYGTHIKPILADGEVHALRGELLSDLRNQAVFHNDVEVSPIGLQHLAVPEGANLAEGPSESFRDVYYSLSDLAALSYLVNQGGGPSDPLPWIRDRFIATRNVAIRVCEAIDTLTAEALPTFGLEVKEVHSDAG